MMMMIFGSIHFKSFLYFYVHRYDLLFLNSSSTQVFRYSTEIRLDAKAGGKNITLAKQ